MSSETEIVVLYCQHCVAQDANVAVAAEQMRGLTVRPTMMPCSSKVEVSHLLRILEQGADGVELVACPEDKCRFLVGSLKAEQRINRARGLLEEIHMGGQRLGLSRRERLSAEALLDLAEARAGAVQPLGPNPMKDSSSRFGERVAGVDGHRRDALVGEPPDRRITGGSLTRDSGDPKPDQLNLELLKKGDAK